MEGLGQQALAAEHRILNVLQDRNQPIQDLIAHFVNYRKLCQTLIFSDFMRAQQVDERMWSIHSRARKWFSEEYKKLCDQPDLKVQKSAFRGFYSKFLRHSTRFYHNHIAKLNDAFQFPELRAIAQMAQPNFGNNASRSQQPVDSESQAEALKSCHRCLIYMGDLARYFAADGLEKKHNEPDYAPASQYYDLASALCPSNGHGHHQQAVVARATGKHLAAVYHLYRSYSVSEPYPNAGINLKAEFDKIASFRRKQEQAQKSASNEPQSPKQVLIGWFVHLHYICFKGRDYAPLDELEQEVLGQLSFEVKQRSLDGDLLRMAMVNMAAQYRAIQEFQSECTPAGPRLLILTFLAVDQSQERERSFFWSLRLNIRFFTALLGLFQDDLFATARHPEMVDAELTEKVLPPSARLLDALRLYSAWLLDNTHLLFGLARDDTLGKYIESFWKAYGRVLDLVTTNFPIWDLEEVAELPYMLEEDADSIGFLPISERGYDRNKKLWLDKTTGKLKPRFSEDATLRAAPEVEMLARIYGFLEDGLYVANDLDESPIKIKGARVYYGNGDELEQLLMPAALEKPAEKPASARQSAPPPKPMSYAKALASAKPAPQKPVAEPVAKPKAPAAPVASESDNTRYGRLTRMVDDLVDDDEANNPVTPPQQYTSNPTVVQANGDSSLALRDSTPDLSQTTGFSKAAPRTSGQLNPLASIWPTSPPGLNTSALLSSPPQAFGHSRVNSANSVHSRASQNVQDSWSSIESAPQGTGMADPRRASGTVLPGLGGDYGQSALLFGSSGGMWSHAPAGGRKSFGSQSRDGGLNG